jgi:hypothetical protein
MEKHHFVYFRLEDLTALRERLRAGDEELTRIYSRLLEQAESALSRRISSVLDKTSVPPSGDKQDFFAIGAYSWPNPNTDNGLPYIRRDGIANPEAYSSDKYDKGRYQSMISDVNVLALAYYYSGDERFAEKAIAFLRSWFINPTTRMKPNLRYAAAQPGVNDGLHSGIIESVLLIEMLDYIALLDESSAWTDSDVAALKRWFLLFSDWLIQSRFGVREFLTSNNHGSYYLAQVMSFAGYGGNHGRAESAIRFVKRQMNQQFASDGSMPKEVRRSNAFFYSIYGLRAFVILARLSERYGADLWWYCIDKQKTPAIAKSFLYLFPYLSGKKNWEGARLDTGINPYAIQICRIAGNAYKEKLFDDMVRFLAAQPNSITPYDALIGFDRTEMHGARNSFFHENFAEHIKQRHDIPSTQLIRKATKFLTLHGLWPYSRLQ